MTDAIVVQLQFEDEIERRTRVVPVGDNKYRYAQDSWSWFFEGDDANDLDRPEYGDVFEATKSGDSTLMFKKVVERANFRRLVFVVPAESIDSQTVHTTRSRIESVGGYWEWTVGNPDIHRVRAVSIFLPPECEYDPTSDLVDSGKGIYEG